MSDSRIGVRPTRVFLSETVLQTVNWAYSQAALRRSTRRAREERPRAAVLVAELHALLPVGAVRGRRHAPLGRAVGIDHRQAGLGQVGGEGGVPEDLLGDVAPGRAPGRPRRTSCPAASGGAYALSQSRYLRERVDRGRPLVAPPRLTLEPTGRQSSTRMPHSSTGSPFGIPVAVARHRQPRIGEAPAERRVLLAVVHVPVTRARRRSRVRRW